jgi:hypothetical protein
MRLRSNSATAPNTEYHLAGRRAGVHLLRVRDEVDSQRLERLQRPEQVRHFWLGILCNSACSSPASAKAIVLLPTPDGPTNSHAPDAGRLQNADNTFLGRSNHARGPVLVGEGLREREVSLHGIPRRWKESLS